MKKLLQPRKSRAGMAVLMSATLAIACSACRPEEPPPPPPDRLVGTWQLDTLINNHFGMPDTTVPIAGELALRADGTGYFYIKSTVFGVVYDDTNNVLSWRNTDSTVTLVSAQDVNTNDTTVYSKLVDLPNAQRWQTLPPKAEATVVFTRK